MHTTVVIKVYRLSVVFKLWHHYHYPEPLIPGMIEPCPLFMLNSDPNQMLQKKSKLIIPDRFFPNFCCPILVNANCSLSFLFLDDRSVVFCCSKPICLKVWYVVCSEMYFSMVATSSYLSYCWLLISVKQSGHSPLLSTSIQDSIFTQNIAVDWIFSLFRMIVYKP